MGELYFVAGMMLLVGIISAAAIYFFVRQYRLERDADLRPKQDDEDGDVDPEN